MSSTLATATSGEDAAPHTGAGKGNGEPPGRFTTTHAHARFVLRSAKAQDRVWTAQDLYYFPTKDEEVYKPEQVTVEGEIYQLMVAGARGGKLDMS